MKNKTLTCADCQRWNFPERNCNVYKTGWRNYDKDNDGYTRPEKMHSKMRACCSFINKAERYRKQFELIF